MEFTNLNRVLTEYAERAVALYKDKLKGSNRIATGELIDSVRSEVKVGDTYIAVDLHLADYWKYVEWDTKPHWPPSGSLLKWIEAKPIIPTPDKRGKLPTPQSLDYLIRRKISKVGTKGTHDLATTIDELNAQFMPRIYEAIDADFGAELDAQIWAFIHS